MSLSGLQLLCARCCCCFFLVLRQAHWRLQNPVSLPQYPLALQVLAFQDEGYNLRALHELNLSLSWRCKGL